MMFDVAVETVCNKTYIFRRSIRATVERLRCQLTCRFLFLSDSSALFIS